MLPNRKLFRPAVLTAAIAATWSCAAYAQNDSTNSASSPSDSVANVTVTATRRVEPLIKVPMAVSVVTGERIISEGLNNIRDVIADVPSVQFRTTASAKDQALFVRGMGTVSTSPAIEPTVATVFDGVPLARQGQINLDLIDVERIEVLRGPQGTLFGKNASAGVIQIITKRPTEYFSGYGETTIRSGNESRVKFGVSGPISEGKWNASLGAATASFDGNVTNVFNGQKVNGYKNDGAAAKFEYVGSPDFKALISVDYSTAHNTTPQGVVSGTTYRIFATGALGVTSANTAAMNSALSPVIASTTNRQINSNYNTYADDTSYGAALQMDWNGAGNHKWTSITGYRRWNNTQFQDQTRLSTLTTNFPLQRDKGELSFNQVSQEIRVASPIGEDHDYVLGMFYMKGDDSEKYGRETTQLVSGRSVINNGVANYSTTNVNYSIFGEWTQHFTKEWSGIAGARLVKDDLNYDFNRVSTSATAVPGIQTNFKSNGSTSKDDYAARLGTKYDLDSNSNIYYTLSRGYKGPAYNVAFSMLPQDISALRPETSVAQEIGYKSSFNGNRSTIGVALFRQNFTDYQVNFQDTFNGSLVTRLINAGRVHTEGLEVDLVHQLSKSFKLSSAVAYVKARVDNFNCPVGTTAACNINGQPLPFAPDWKVNLTAEYSVPLANSGSVKFGTNYNWQSQTQFNILQTPETIQPAYGIWNAYASWSHGTGWTTSFLVKNINNTNYSTNIGTFGGGVVRWVPRDAERFFGLTVRKEF
jgi:iron complex outermembrane receptor protein